MENEILTLCNEYPIIAILGPRQSGKTTLAKKLFPDYSYISLEDLDHREFAQNDPRGFLNRFQDHVIFDEIQRTPNLFSYLQTHVDNREITGSIIITGSHNFLLLEKISQSLAGRVGITRLLPFSSHELRHLKIDLTEIIFKGTYPRIYDKNLRPETFYKNYVSTYIEKDVRQIKQITNINGFTKFIQILAGRTGQELNNSSLSEQCGISHTTVREWISVLEASFIIFRIPPYHKNYNKRLVKNHKVYFTDTGLVCSLLGIRKKDQIDYHFLKGALFETFVVSELLKARFNTGDRFDLFFWRDNHQKEIDLILESGSNQLCIEIKSGQTIHRSAFKNLKYWKKIAVEDRPKTYLVYAGQDSYEQNDAMVIGWSDIFTTLVKPIV